MVGHLGATSLAGLSLASTGLTTVVGLFVEGGVEPVDDLRTDLLA